MDMVQRCWIMQKKIKHCYSEIVLDASLPAKRSIENVDIQKENLKQFKQAAMIFML